MTINVKARYNVLEYIDFPRDYDTLLSIWLGYSIYVQVRVSILASGADAGMTEQVSVKLVFLYRCRCLFGL